MPEMQGTSQVSQETQNDQQNNPASEAPIAVSVSVSIANSNSRKVTREDIEVVQQLIEQCLRLYMNRADVVKTLLNQAKIEPGFTSLVWQKLEEENSEFFRAYYIRLKLKKQIILFNQLLEHQYHLMKHTMPPRLPLAPAQNGIHPMPVNNLPMGYPVLQQTSIPAPSQPHLDSVGSGLSSCSVVNGVPAPGNFHPIRINSGNVTVVDSSASDLASVMPPGSAMSSISDTAVSPASASSGHFPFTQEMSGIGVDTSLLDTAFTSDVASTVDLQLGPDGGAGSTRDFLRSLAPIPWNFSLSGLDLTNIGGCASWREQPMASSHTFNHIGPTKTLEPWGTTATPPCYPLSQAFCLTPQNMMIQLRTSLLILSRHSAPNQMKVSHRKSEVHPLSFRIFFSTGLSCKGLLVTDSTFMLRSKLST